MNKYTSLVVMMLSIITVSLIPSPVRAEKAFTFVIDLNTDAGSDLYTIFAAGWAGFQFLTVLGFAFAGVIFVAMSRIKEGALAFLGGGVLVVFYEILPHLPQIFGGVGMTMSMIALLIIILIIMVVIRVTGLTTGFINLGTGG